MKSKLWHEITNFFPGNVRFRHCIEVKVLWRGGECLIRSDFDYALNNSWAFLLVDHVEGGSGVSCKDIQGRTYESGLHYIPGPAPCTLCICDDGNPKWCKAVICTSPQVNCDNCPNRDNWRRAFNCQTWREIALMRCCVDRKVNCIS